MMSTRSNTRRCDVTPFTVLLLYPDYMVDNFGQETYLAHVFASDTANAIAYARNEIRAQDQDPSDFYCLFCTTGHHVDISGSMR